MENRRQRRPQRRRRVGIQGSASVSTGPPCGPIAKPQSSAPGSAVPHGASWRAAKRWSVASVRSRLVTAKRRSGCRASLALIGPDNYVS
jgi:hypothetical protein